MPVVETEHPNRDGIFLVDLTRCGLVIDILVMEDIPPNLGIGIISVINRFVGVEFNVWAIPARRFERAIV